ncbi:MAG: hypothetical protein WKF75_02880 [Singulisphaera sp.]
MITKLSNDLSAQGIVPTVRAYDQEVFVTPSHSSFFIFRTPGYISVDVHANLLP